MTISCKIICDSISPNKIRLSTLQLRYPRFIHSELMTHRVFSRNASSSRAIPVKRLIDDIIDDPVIPMHWGKNQKGMQADEECDEPVELGKFSFQWDMKYAPERERAWLWARDNALSVAKAFSEAGYHKQIVNRLLEPFSHINVLVTSTKWANFFVLRDHKDAQPEIRILAQEIKMALKDSTPKFIDHDKWHLPYITDKELKELSEWDGEYSPLQVSVARCARVSYLTREGKEPSIKEDSELYYRLIGSQPLHASPAEHQATPDRRKGDNQIDGFGWENTNLHGNFHGWIQYRKTLENEYVSD